MSSIQGGRQNQETNLPNKTKLIKKNVNSQQLKDKMAYFDIKTPNMKFASLFEQTTELLNEIIKNSNVQNEVLSQNLQEIEKNIKSMNQERSRVQKELSEFAFGHILHMIDIYQNSDDLNHKYISFYLMKVWIKNFQYSEEYVDAILASIDENLSFQKEIFSFLQELSIEKPDVLDKILKIANQITTSFQGMINSDQEENQQEKKTVSGFTKQKSQEDFLEFILNILQKFESQELENQLINIIQKYVPSNKMQYHKIILENFLNNEEIYEKYFSICIELIKKGFDEQDIQIVLQYIKKAEAFYLKIKNSSRRGEFVKLLISNLLFLRQIKKQEISKPIRHLWKPTIFSDQEGQEKILEHQEEIISYLCSKFTSGEEETITMATDGLLEIMEKVIKGSTNLQSAPNNKKINYFQQILNGCINNMQNQEKYFQLLAKFADLLGLKQSLQIQALVRLEWKNVANLDINSIYNYYQKQSIDLRAELLKFKQFTAASFFLFILNKKVMSKDIEQAFNQVENNVIGLYKMNHNIIHGFLSEFSEIPQSKAILETNLYHYFKLERVSQLKELEKYYGQDYIKNLIISSKGEQYYQTYLQQTSTIQNSQANILNQQQQENNNKIHSAKEYVYVSYDQKRQMFAHLNIPTYSQATQNQVVKIDSGQMEIEQQTKPNKVQEKHKPTHENNSNKNKQVSGQKPNHQSQEIIHQKNQHKTNLAQNPSSQAQSKTHHNKNQQKINTPTKQSQDQQGQKDQQTKEQSQTEEKQAKEYLLRQQQVQEESQQIQEEQQVQEAQQAQEQPQQVQEEMQIEDIENNKKQTEIEQKKDIIIENESQSLKETNIQKLQEQQIELKQQEQQQNSSNQKEEIQIKSSQIFEVNPKESHLMEAQEERQQPQQGQTIQEAGQKHDKMDIEENKQEQQKKQESTIAQTKDLNSSSNNTTQKVYLPFLSIKKPGIQLSLPQSNQQPTSQSNLVSQKQPQTINQESTQSESKDKKNIDQNNQKPSQAGNQTKPKLSIKEQALLKMKNKQDATKQNNMQTTSAEQIEQPKETQKEKAEENLPKPVIGIPPTLELKSQQQQNQIDQQIKKADSPVKQPSESKPQIDLTKKPSLLMMKKKQEQQNPSTPINQNANTEKMEIEQSQPQQVLEPSQNSEKIKQKPALSLKPKIQLKSIEKQQTEQIQQKVEENTTKVDQPEKVEVEDLQIAEDKQNEQISLNSTNEKQSQDTLTQKINEKENSNETSNVINKAEQIIDEHVEESNNMQTQQQVKSKEDNSLNIDSNQEKIEESNHDIKNENSTDQVEQKQILEVEQEAQQIESEQQSEKQQEEEKKQEDEVVQNTQPDQELQTQNEEEVEKNQTGLNEIEMENQGEENALNNKTIQNGNQEIEANEVLLQDNQEEIQDVVNTVEEEDQQPTTSQANQDEQIQEEVEDFQALEEQVEEITQEQTHKSQQEEQPNQLENEQENQQQVEQQADDQDQDQGYINQQEENEQANLEQINEETKESKEGKAEEQKN